MVRFFYHILKYSLSSYYLGLLVEISKIELVADQELLNVFFNQPLEIGSGRLSMKYSGILNDNMKGFYRVKYKHALSKQPYTATTQFEVIDNKLVYYII
jgi:hypothetical protein